MKDLIITYTSENKVIKKEYDHIFDFTDEIEDTNISLPTQRNITATFFENRTEKFNTMDALYVHEKRNHYSYRQRWNRGTYP